MQMIKMHIQRANTLSKFNNNFIHLQQQKSKESYNKNLHNLILQTSLHNFLYKILQTTNGISY